MAGPFRHFIGMLMMKTLVVFLVLGLIAPSLGCDRRNSWTTESGLRVTEVIEGEGDLPDKGDILKIRYTGWYLDGKKFDSTDKLDGPATVRFGKGDLLPGLEIPLGDLFA